MKMYGRRMARATAPVIGALALLATGAVTAPLEAQAAPLGRVCMFEAPRGAYGAGHAAFAIKVRGETNHWIFGSFGSTNDAPKAGWIKGGTWEKARGHFTSVRDKDHNNARYYTRYRCVNTRDGDVKRSQSWYTTVKSRGYNVTTNNCLHMSMAVFKGYSEILRKDTRLKSATRWTPNDYYKEVLPAARWEASHSL
ncbi:hypothetical protein SAM9427_36205 (plasmid) [Streptomyces sp. ETH9427]|uniref:hypothetical protein n=1 Tax=Streptomyces sp. E1N211 TaxID=1851876 RepID=UPI000E0C49FB|nr:hypothetical protein [Streptomyces sp. E1N211]AXI91223.1 hypothetical protein SAM9427_36205 [Streptomyces sp. ETH9427]